MTVDISYNMLKSLKELLFLKFIESLIEIHFNGNDKCFESEKNINQILDDNPYLEVVNGIVYSLPGAKEDHLTDSLLKDMKEELIDVSREETEILTQRKIKAKIAENSDDDSLSDEENSEYMRTFKMYNRKDIKLKNRKVIRPQSANPHLKHLQGVQGQHEFIPDIKGFN